METMAQHAEVKSHRSTHTDWARLAFWTIYFGLIAGLASTIF